jgi:hypothetical protein
MHSAKGMRSPGHGRRREGGGAHLVEEVLWVQRLLVDLLEVEGPVVERLVVVVLDTLRVRTTRHDSKKRANLERAHTSNGAHN